MLYGRQRRLEVQRGRRFAKRLEGDLIESLKRAGLKPTSQALKYFRQQVIYGENGWLSPGFKSISKEELRQTFIQKTRLAFNSEEASNEIGSIDERLVRDGESSYLREIDTEQLLKFTVRLCPGFWPFC